MIKLGLSIDETEEEVSEQDLPPLEEDGGEEGSKMEEVD